jgi:hypothetical protein
MSLFVQSVLGGMSNGTMYQITSLDGDVRRSVVSNQILR